MHVFGLLLITFSSWFMQVFNFCFYSSGVFSKWGKEKEKASKKHAFACFPLFACRNVGSFVLFIEVYEYPFSFFSLPSSRIIYFHFIQSLAWSWMLGIELTFSFCKVYIFKNRCSQTKRWSCQHDFCQLCTAFAFLLFFLTLLLVSFLF